MNIVLQEPWTVERFLAWEDAQEGKHEFDGVRIVPMTGGSRRHQRIVMNLLMALEERLDLNAFDVVQEMRISFDGKVRYPDVSVCSGRIQDETRTLHDAIAVFEVLSDETAAVDKTEKRSDYASLPGVKYYVMVEQNRIAATVLEFFEGHWKETELTSRSISLPEIRVELPIAAIYRGLQV